MVPLEVEILEVDPIEMDDFSEDERVQIRPKLIERREVEISGRFYDLFQDFNTRGRPFYYLVLNYGDGEDMRMGGFLADEFGNLIDLDGRILTSLDDLESFL